jgi:hypothetical protein
MKIVKPLNELTFEELCVHMADCQEIIERNEEQWLKDLKTLYDNCDQGRIVLFCEKCKSPYRISLRQNDLPFCDWCYGHSTITIREIALVSGIDKYLRILSRQFVRAAQKLDENKADSILNMIYDYIYGEEIWYKQKLWEGDDLNTRPYDFVEAFQDSDDRPNKYSMLQMLREEINDTIRYRDDSLRKVHRIEIDKYRNLGMDIPRHVERISLKQFRPLS